LLRQHRSFQHLLIARARKGTPGVISKTSLVMIAHERRQSNGRARFVEHIGAEQVRQRFGAGVAGERAQNCSTESEVDHRR